jgi:dTDP-4-dehydrorhamnose 3,5-epimerase
MSLRVLPTSLPGVVTLHSDAARDFRGSFARLSCTATVAAQGIAFWSRQTSISRSVRCGTLRGLHFQAAPAEETKIIHCVVGAVFDVVLDLRSESPMFRKAFTMEMRAEGPGLLVPPGCAHGLLTLTDDAVVLYQMDRDYDPDRARGVRWNDRAFAIDWPSAPVVISDRDATWPDFAG